MIASTEAGPGERVEYAGVVSLDEWMAAARLAVRGRQEPLSRQILANGILVLLMIGTLLTTGRIGTLFLLGLVIVLLVVTTRNQRLLARWRKALRHDYAHNPAYPARFRSVWDATGFRTTSAAFDDIRGWTDFSAWRENENYVLVFETVGFRPIPKRMLGDQVETLRTMLTNRVGPAC